MSCRVDAPAGITARRSLAERAVSMIFPSQEDDDRPDALPPLSGFDRPTGSHALSWEMNASFAGPSKPSPSGIVPPSLMFEGRSGSECEDFIRSVKSEAFRQGKHRDDEWLADLASVAFAGPALRWFEELDHETRSSWKLLCRALLDKYPATVTESHPGNPFVPTPAAAISKPHEATTSAPSPQDATAAATSSASPNVLKKNRRSSLKFGGGLSSLFKRRVSKS